MASIRSEHVAVYIRWSTEDQDQNTTLDVQRDSCKHFALSHGYTISPENIYVDDGYSGGSLDRPAMTRLRNDIKNGRIRLVIVRNVDRLSRNIVDATYLVLREWAGVCDLKCVLQAIDTTTELGKMIFSILATFADYERSQITVRLFSGKVKRAAEGRNPGIRLPYGYLVGATPGSIAIDPERAEVVKRIFRLCLEGKGIRGIASILNEEGVPSYRKGLWHGSGIKYVLENQAYAGRMIYGRTKRVGQTSSRERRETPLVSEESVYPPIIDQETWNRCHGVRKERQKFTKDVGPRTASSPYLLTGIIRCTCGRTMQSHLGSRGDRKPYYICPARYERGESGCRNGWIPQAEVDHRVVDDIQIVASTAKEMILQNLQGERSERLNETNVRLDACRKRLTKLDRGETKIRADYRDGDLTAKAYTQLMEDVEGEREKAKREERALLTEIEEYVAHNQNQLGVKEALERMPLWDSLQHTERKWLLNTLVDKLVVYRPVKSNDPIHIDLRIRGITH